jgi:hypothetical protein
MVSVVEVDEFLNIRYDDEALVNLQALGAGVLRSL